jgi:hypothetical protein
VGITLLTDCRGVEFRKELALFSETPCPADLDISANCSKDYHISEGSAPNGDMGHSDMKINRRSGLGSKRSSSVVI